MTNIFKIMETRYHKLRLSHIRQPMRYLVVLVTVCCCCSVL